MIFYSLRIGTFTQEHNMIIINWTNLDVGEDAGRGVGYDHRHGINGGVGLEVNQVQTLRDRDVRHLHNMSISNEDGNIHLKFVHQDTIAIQ